MTWSWENELQCESCVFDSGDFATTLKVGKSLRDDVVEDKYHLRSGPEDAAVRHNER